MDPSKLPPSAFLPDDRGHQLKNTAIAFMVVETLFVGLRYVSRYLIRSRSGADDWLMPLAWVFNIGLCGVAIGKIAFGFLSTNAVRRKQGEDWLLTGIYSYGSRWRCRASYWVAHEKRP
jgi:hypothetical protein